MVINTRTALATAVLSLSLATASAQQAGHQMAGMASGSGGAAMCAQNSEGVTRTIDLVNARIEDARQANDAGKLRAGHAAPCTLAPATTLKRSPRRCCAGAIGGDASSGGESLTQQGGDEGRVGTAAGGLHHLAHQ